MNATSKRLPKDLVIHMGRFLKPGDLNAFALTDKFHNESLSEALRNWKPVMKNVHEMLDCGRVVKLHMARLRSLLTVMQNEEDTEDDENLEFYRSVVQIAESATTCLDSFLDRVM